MNNEILRINSLTKTYKSNEHTVHALNDVSFSINEGEIFSLLGVNGAAYGGFAARGRLRVPADAKPLFFARAFYAVFCLSDA